MYKCSQMFTKQWNVQTRHCVTHDRNRRQNRQLRLWCRHLANMTKHNVVVDSALLAPLCENMTSSTQPVARYTARVHVLRDPSANWQHPSIAATFNTDDAHPVSLCLNWTTATPHLPVCHAAFWTDCRLSSTLLHVSQLACSATTTSYRHLRLTDWVKVLRPT